MTNTVCGVQQAMAVAYNASQFPVRRYFHRPHYIKKSVNLLYFLYETRIPRIFYAAAIIKIHAADTENQKISKNFLLRIITKNFLENWEAYTFLCNCSRGYRQVPRAHALGTKFFFIISCKFPLKKIVKKSVIFAILIQ